MAIMKKDVTLRVEPNGQRGSELAREGDQVDVTGTQEVDVLGGGKESWTKIQLLDADGVPEGWVPTSSVDLAGVVPDGPIDLHKFARQCWWERLISDVNPYYLVAVAKLRSGVSGGQEAGNIGPFRLTQAEWDTGRSDAQFGLKDYRARDIADWRMQCVMFELMARRALELLSSALRRQPSWVELYLAQLIGPQAAAAAIKSPNDTVEAAFANVQPADFPPGGLTASQLLERYAKFLRDVGPPVTAVKGQAALDRIAADLQAALVKVRTAVDEVGNEFFGDEPNGDSIGHPTDPIPGSQEGGNIGTDPGADPNPLNPGAGGILGELIAKHESGRAGYGAFNRGRAGDSVGKSLDFSRMKIREIMARQSLRRGDPNKLLAVGKYQIITGTMQFVVSRLGIDPNDKLTHQLQERMFRNGLMAAKRPRVKAYITGRSPDLNAALIALSNEFAAVALPGGGSNLAGIGGNRPSIRAQKAAEALNQEREAFRRNRASGKTEQQAWDALSPGMS